jgi:ketosteroid isomerase-like protein
MKKLMSIGFVLLFSFFMVSCGGSSDNPQDVAKDFMKALADKDYDKAKDLGTENTVMMIGMIESMAGMATEGEEQEMGELVWGDTEIDGDSAICYYTEEGKEGQQQVDLIKVDGDWKVDMKKEQ